MNKTEIKLIEEFAHLEQICNQIYGEQHGVTKYIEDMENRKLNRSPEYKDDYYKLKRVRHIRNGLVHSGTKNLPDCTNDDTEFVENFAKRILNGTDPLCSNQKTKKNSSKNSRSWLMWAIIIVLIICVIAAYILLKAK